MTNNHLSDDELQLFAGGEQIPEPGMVQHIETCTLCQEQLALYKLIFSGIKEQPTAGFDFDLADLVVPHLEPIRRKQPVTHLRPAIVATFVSIALYLFRKNFLHLATGISVAFLLISIVTCFCIVIFKCLKIYHRYQSQVEKLNYSE